MCDHDNPNMAWLRYFGVDDMRKITSTVTFNCIILALKLSEQNHPEIHSFMLRDGALVLISKDFYYIIVKPGGPVMIEGMVFPVANVWYEPVTEANSKRLILACNDSVEYLLPRGTPDEDAYAAARRMNAAKTDQRFIFRVTDVKEITQAQLAVIEK
jgi:hypothetical protein